MPKLERLVFFGTPEFALPSLVALCDAGRAPRLVISQPARPAGRGAETADPPVARWAKEHGLAVLQPEKVRDPAVLEQLRELAPDLAVVVAFGQIFPPALLALPVHGCVNVHASLLPKFRGAAPVQAAIAAGESRTGVTLMQMEEELDAGPILLQEAIDIGAEESGGELAERLSGLGARLLLATLERLEEGSLKPRKQAHELATYAPRLRREDGKVDWALDAREICNRLRAYTPWPGLYGFFRNRKLKILRARPIDWEMAPTGISGTFLGLRQGRLAVLCGGATILGIEHLQREGRKPVRPSEFLNGERLRIGERLA